MKNLHKRIELDCSLDKAWWFWTTKEGLNSFFGADNNIEVKLGGPYEIYFNLDAPEGERGSEGCKVLSFIENKMLSFTWNAPPTLNKARNSGKHTFVTIHFEEVNSTKIGLTLHHGGWIHEGEEWEATHSYFNNAWNMVLDWLEKASKENTNS